ncbi:PAS domain-containing sensor histidine kinase [Bradyrhizobium sp. Leo121]|uniref:PAS domain-containing sensor histidine kinase n=1 Tax=Bradyrhizobium sp. Leo121 TaxID=1571195 RepID=UPI0013EF15AE|nr:PAS domain-containing sensor histidine kinase [Bradyrhizobium sp. Leo121]
MVLSAEYSVESGARLQRCIDDLNKILALPATDQDGSSSRPLSDLLDVLLVMLQLEFVYARCSESAGTAPIEIVRTAQQRDKSLGPPEIGNVLDGSLGSDLQKWPSHAKIAICGIDMSIVLLKLGPQADFGVLVAASRRTDFPDDTERLRLSVAARHAVIGLQQARLLDERKQAANVIDQQVAQRTEELAASNEDLRRKIEERKREVEALRVREIDIQLVVDAIPAPLAIMTADGEVEAVNRPVLEYFGSSVEELKRWSATDAVHPEDLAPTINAWRQAVETGNRYEVESRHRRSDGVYRWFHVRGFPLRDNNGRIVRWCVLQIDIEDRKRAEEALRASERDLNLIINTIPALVWSASSDGSAEYFNQHYQDYVGFGLEQAQGWGWTAAIHPDDRNGVAHAWQSIMASRQAGEKEARLRRFDGTYRWFLFRVNPLRDSSGNVIKWFGINTDIEDRKRTEEKLRDTQGKLAHMARVMTMGELTASIAHEINQPLSGIVTNASTCLRMLAADPPNVAGARETVRRTIRDGNRASEIVARLRALFNRNAPVTGPVDLNEATREVITLSLNRLHRDGIVLRTELTEDLPLVTGDRIQLQQVILNLLQNAMDAMSTIDDRSRELIIQTAQDEIDCVRLSMQDSGPGFDFEAIERLFDAFYTTKQGGMGIGLSVSRSIIENHHGCLWATLNDGPGATFSFSIPRVSEGVTSVRGPDAKGTLDGNGVTRNV